MGIQKRQSFFDIIFIVCCNYTSMALIQNVYFEKINLTTQKLKFSIKDFFSKFDQIHSVLRIWSNLLKKSLTKNFAFCAVSM